MRRILAGAAGGVLITVMCAVHVLGSELAPEEQSLVKERFTYKQALTGIQYINGYLQSFRQLTHVSAGRITPAESREIQHLSWEEQNLGFVNWSGTVEGTLRQQEYKIKQLEYQLAAQRYASGQGSRQDMEARQEAYLTAKKEFTLYLSTFKIAD